MIFFEMKKKKKLSRHRRTSPYTTYTSRRSIENQTFDSGFFYKKDIISGEMAPLTFCRGTTRAWRAVFLL